MKNSQGGSAIISFKLAVGLACLLDQSLSATERFVDLNSTNATPPFTDWATAAVTIQDAIDVADPGDLIWVTNGVYATGGRVVSPSLLTNRVAVTKPVTVQSVNGPDVTVIQGYQEGIYNNSTSVVRCIYLSTNATLLGFTLTNGATPTYGRSIDLYGGGVKGESGSVVSNCVFVGNTASPSGGGAYFTTLISCILSNNYSWTEGGGAGSATLNNCTLLGNCALGQGGGASSSTLNDCLVVSNRADGGTGGGTYNSTLNNCKLVGNSAQGTGGASYCVLNNCTVTENQAGAYNCTLTNCVLTSNTKSAALSCTLYNCLVSSNSSGARGAAKESTLYSCTLTWNTGSDSGGAANRCALYNCLVISNSAFVGGGMYYSTGYNCTIMGNTATFGGGVYGGTNNNCIVYYNNASGMTSNHVNSLFRYCGTAPLAAGVGNITNEPLFMDLEGGNYRVQSSSPYINAGTNFYAPTGPDLDGNPRIVGGTVDVGAYEQQSPALLPFFSWLQDYGLSTYSPDLYTDADLDRMNNWQEWRFGTDPTNALSALRLLVPEASLQNPESRTVTWESVTNRSYFLERGTNLDSRYWILDTGFSIVATNLAGQLGATSYTSTNAVGSRLFYYRVGVQEP